MLKTFLLIGVVQGFFLILLLKFKEEKRESDYLLMAWLGIVSLQLMFYYDNSSKFPALPVFSQILGFYLPLVSSPILYLYISSLTLGYKFINRQQLSHLLTYTVCCLIGIYMNIGSSMNIQFKNGLPVFGNGISFWLQYLLTVPLGFFPGLYAILGLRKLINYQKLIPEHYSYSEKINFNWLKWITISLVVLFIVLFPLITFSINSEFINHSPTLFLVVGSILAFYILIVGFFGIRQRNVFTNFLLETNQVTTHSSKPNYKNSGLTDEMIDKLFQNLTSHMKDNKPYLDESLSLNMLAQQLGLTTNQLSQIINQKTSSNFFNFVNNYRVEEVKKKLKDPAYAHYSILAIGYDCGFNSKSSFNKIFKSMVNQTPSEFQKS